MDNQTLIISLVIFIGVLSSIYYFVITSRKKDKERVDLDWVKFIEAIENLKIQEINLIGEKLIYNSFLSKQRLKVISNVINNDLKDYDEFEQLRILTLNKIAHYNRPILTAGTKGSDQSNWTI